MSSESVPERALMPVVHHVGVLHGSLDSPMPSERLSGCTVWPSELHLACLCRPDCLWTSKSNRMSLQRRFDYRPKAGHNMSCQLGSLALTPACPDPGSFPDSCNRLPWPQQLPWPWQLSWPWTSAWPEHPPWLSQLS